MDITGFKTTVFIFFSFKKKYLFCRKLIFFFFGRPIFPLFLSFINARVDDDMKQRCVDWAACEIE